MTDSRAILDGLPKPKLLFRLVADSMERRVGTNLIRFKLAPWNEDVLGKAPTVEVCVTDEVLANGLEMESQVVDAAFREVVDLLRIGLGVIATEELVLCSECRMVQIDEDGRSMKRCDSHQCRVCLEIFVGRGRPE